MEQTSLISGHWQAFLSALPPTLDLEASAREFKALLRRRGVPDAASLLRLALAYGPCGMSLRGNAAWAEAGEIATLANTSLLERLRNSTEWLGEIVRHLLMARMSSAMPWVARRIVTLSDGSSLSEPGSTGTDWRLHVVFDLGNCSVRHVEVTDAKGAESLRRGVLEAGEIRIADRGYAKAKDLYDVVEHGAVAKALISVYLLPEVMLRRMPMSVREPDGFHESLRREDEVEGATDRSFGLLCSGLCALIGAIKLWHASCVGWWWLGASGAFLAVALMVPGFLGPANRVWLKFGLLLHHVVEPVVMGLLFALTVVPTGLAMRLAGKDLLRLKWDSKATSYWILRTPPGPSPESIRQQF